MQQILMSSTHHPHNDAEVGIISSTVYALWNESRVTLYYSTVLVCRSTSGALGSPKGHSSTVYNLSVCAAVSCGSLGCTSHSCPQVSWCNIMEGLVQLGVSLLGRRFPLISYLPAASNTFPRVLNSCVQTLGGNDAFHSEHFAQNDALCPLQQSLRIFCKNSQVAKRFRLKTTATNAASVERKDRNSWVQTTLCLKDC